MPIVSVTDELISELKSRHKYVTNPRPKLRLGSGVTRGAFHVVAVGGDQSFELFVRENENSFERSDFSCGLIWVSPAVGRLTLCRYNGNSHRHVNFLEKEEIVHQFHIHFATERYITAGLKPESYAIASDAYNSLGTALKCLAHDWNILGLSEALALHHDSV